MTRTRQILCGVALVGVTAAITSAVTYQGEADIAEEFSVRTKHHDVLDQLWGKWNYAITKVGDEAEPLDLAAEYRWIFGGRFLIGNYEGYIDGAFFEAKEVLGYDAFRGEYQALWIDNATTAFTMSTGHYDARTRQLTIAGTQDDVETGKRDQSFKFVYQFQAGDRFTMTIYREDATGKLARYLTVSATRWGMEDQ